LRDAQSDLPRTLVVGEKKAEYGKIV